MKPRPRGTPRICGAGGVRLAGCVHCQSLLVDLSHWPATASLGEECSWIDLGAGRHSSVGADVLDGRPRRPAPAGGRTALRRDGHNPAPDTQVSFPGQSAVEAWRAALCRPTHWARARRRRPGTDERRRTAFCCPALGDSWSAVGRAALFRPGHRFGAQDPNSPSAARPRGLAMAHHVPGRCTGSALRDPARRSKLGANGTPPAGQTGSRLDTRRSAPRARDPRLATRGSTPRPGDWRTASWRSTSGLATQGSALDD